MGVEHKTLQTIRAMAKHDREVYLENLSKSIDNNFSHQNLKAAYKVIKELRPKSERSVNSTINKSNGSPCSSDEESLDRWKEHFEAALNHPPAPSCPDLDIPVAPPIDLEPEDAPTLEEVKSAIRELKNGRAAGPDHIPPELLKCAIDPISAVLHKLFLQVWRSGKAPAEWKEGIIVTLYKGKGPRTECSSYRPITLLSVPGKVFCSRPPGPVEPPAC